MAKTKTLYICQSCGKVYGSWQGRCSSCGEWNSIVEEIVTNDSSKKEHRKASKPLPVSQYKLSQEERLSSGSTELDRTLGGGIVNGEVALLGGPPGIGKSTMLLQVGLCLAKKGKTILYVCGEESPEQIKIRIKRLKNEPEDTFYLLPETDVEYVIEQAKGLAPDLIIIDSIQTLKVTEVGTAPGTISQIKASAMELMKFAKSANASTFIVGHITKSGSIAGPKILEHIVDCVLYFQGDMQQEYRIIRAIKNRFGSTNEIGIFKMGESGLAEVKNPSEIFLSEHDDSVSGTSIVAGLEGTRPLLVEVQALVTPSAYSSPQRVVRGLSRERVSLLCALLEKRVGLPLQSQDVFLNIVGGVKLEEPAIDLGIVLAIVSSFRDIPLKSSLVVIGEVGLGGEIRPVSYCQKRVTEAERLGFKKIILPAKSKTKNSKTLGIQQVGVKNLFESFKFSLNSKGK